MDIRKIYMACYGIRSIWSKIQYMQSATPEIQKVILKRQRERIQQDMSEKTELISMISVLIGED